MSEERKGTHTNDLPNEFEMFTFTTNKVVNTHTHLHSHNNMTLTTKDCDLGVSLITLKGLWRFNQTAEFIIHIGINIYTDRSVTGMNVTQHSNVKKTLF